MQTKYTSKDIVRFWGKVDKETSTVFYNGLKCWEWIAGCTKSGYGNIRIAREMIRAHRVSYELSFGEIPQGLEVCHHCDNPICVRPEHLFLGTHKENMGDMVKKGRQARVCGELNGARLHPETRARGETNGMHKLTDEKVFEIRQRYRQGETQTALAEEYGIHQTQISNIVNYKQRK